MVKIHPGAFDRRPRSAKGKVSGRAAAGYECPECYDHLRLVSKNSWSKHYLHCRNCGFQKPVIRGRVSFS